MCFSSTPVPPTAAKAADLTVFDFVAKDIGRLTRDVKGKAGTGRGVTLLRAGATLLRDGATLLRIGATVAARRRNTAARRRNACCATAQRCYASAQRLLRVGATLLRVGATVAARRRNAAAHRRNACCASAQHCCASAQRCYATAQRLLRIGSTLLRRGCARVRRGRNVASHRGVHVFLFQSAGGLSNNLRVLPKSRHGATSADPRNSRAHDRTRASQRGATAAAPDPRRGGGLRPRVRSLAAAVERM
jgi:hypothetical protein